VTKEVVFLINDQRCKIQLNHNNHFFRVVEYYKAQDPTISLCFPLNVHALFPFHLPINHLGYNSPAFFFFFTCMVYLSNIFSQEGCLGVFPHYTINLNNALEQNKCVLDGQS
jgi:hypothetical protein